MSETTSRFPSEITALEWRQIVQSATDTAIVTMDPQGRVTSWNEGARNILGWTEAEMLGQSLERIFLPQDTELIAHEMKDALEQGRGGGDEGWRLRRDGSRFWAAGAITPIRVEQGQLTGFV